MFLTHALRAISRGIAVVTDPFFKYVGLLLTGNGTNGAQNNTFVDSSTNNFTITRVGNTTQGTFTPYGSNWSNYFDGTGDYLTTASNAALGFGTGDFTIEGWFYFTGTIATYQRPWWFGDDNENLEINAGVIRFGGASLTVITGPTAIANTWYHIAYSRASGSGRLYVNGTQVGSTTASSYNSSARTFTLMATSAGVNPSTGYVSNFRIVKGTAVYTADFTPPTAPLTAITNTSLLTCQSNRLIDNSTNNFTITKNGDVSVQRFSPYSPAASYSTSEVGGSGYFDATGDWLTVPSSNVFLFGTGDFTIEFWVYPNAFSGRIFYGGTSSAVNITMSSSGAIVYGTITSGTIRATSAGAAPLNVWTHVAIARASGITRIFVNGVNASQGSDATNWASGSTVRIGSDTVGSFTGLISSLRVVKGTAVYTANFAPPTAPLTAITNTSLLLNFTNGGIIDNAMMNDLETVGNTQISTAQSKFGGSSMYFDGTGDYLTIPSNTNLELGGGDFTIEAWIYLNAYANAGAIISKGVNGAYLIYMGAGNELAFYASTTGSGWSVSNVTIASPPSLNTWHHIAVVRSGNLVSTYFNGTFVANASLTGSLVSQPTVPVLVGYYSNSINAYIDDLRITKGYARYTANFTPPTAALPTS